MTNRKTRKLKKLANTTGGLILSALIGAFASVLFTNAFGNQKPETAPVINMCAEGCVQNIYQGQQPVDQHLSYERSNHGQ
jgi:hypothetical protein